MLILCRESEFQIFVSRLSRRYILFHLDAMIL